MGVMDWMNDDEDGGEEDATDAFDEEMDGVGQLDDEMGELGSDAGDEFEETERFGGDLGDGFAGDELDDDFGGDAGDNKVAELEDRIGEMENQVSSLSSDMNTVRQENIQIGETVDELDDTIRKLLDIYEMVTRGINPFVDDAREMGGIDGGDGAFGLFDAEETTESENLDDDVAAADPDSFFDDDLGRLDTAAGEQKAEIAAEDELSEEERNAAPGLEGDADEPDESASDPADAAGASFDELKAEYQSGDGEWSDGEDTADADPTEAFDDVTEPEGEAETDGEETPDDAAEPADYSETLDGTTPPDGDDLSGGPDADADEAADATDDANAATTSTAATDATGTGDDDEDAYLASLPPSYVAETLLLEWADYLVAEGGARNAVRAVRQYREFGWLSTRAADDFEAYVVGAADASSPAGGDVLTVDHHATSLSYVVRLAGDSPAPELELEPRFEDDLTALLGGEGSGIRR